MMILADILTSFTSRVRDALYKNGIFITVLDKTTTMPHKSQRRPAHLGERALARFGYTYESMATEKAYGSMEPFIVTLIPGDRSETSAYEGQESIYILEGKNKLKGWAQTEKLNIGDAVYYDSFRSHPVTTVNNKQSTILAVINLNRNDCAGNVFQDDRDVRSFVNKY